MLTLEKHAVADHGSWNRAAHAFLQAIHLVIEAAVFYDVSADYLLGLTDMWPDTSTTATTHQE